MPWSTSSGRKTDYIGTIIKSEFGMQQFDSGPTQMLFLKFLIEEENMEWDESYSLGGKWFPSNDGTIAEHEDGLKDGQYRPFSGSSNYGKFIDAAMKLIPMEELETLGDPAEAKVWLGMRFKMSEVETGKDRETKQPRTKNLPVEYFGRGETVDNSDLDAELKALAVEAPDHNTFMEKALTLPGVEGNTVLVMQIADPDGLYQELRNGNRDSEATPSR